MCPGGLTGAQRPTVQECARQKNGWREGKGGGEQEPVPASFSGTAGDLVWALTLNTSILTPRQSERLVSPLNGAAISKHGEACKSNNPAIDFL